MRDVEHVMSTEAWNSAWMSNDLEEHYKEKRWICSARSKLTKQGEDPDPAAGVAILLSPRMTVIITNNNNKKDLIDMYRFVHGCSANAN